MRLQSQFPKAICIVLLLLCINNSMGATYYAIANDNWNNNTTWSLSSGGAAVGAGIFPGSGDDVNFGQFTVTLTANAACKNLDNYGGTGTLDLGNNTLSVSGDITIHPAAPTFTSTGGYLNMNGATQTIQLSSSNIIIPYLEFTNGTQVTQKDQGNITVTGNLNSVGSGSSYTEDTWAWWQSGALIVTGTVTAPGTTFVVTNPGINAPAAIDFSGSSSDPVIVGGVSLTVNSTITFGTKNVTTTTAFVHTAGVITSGTITVAATLPIELTNFIIEINKDGNVLSWFTATEKNNDFFTIERSEDGINWIEIYMCKGAGTSTLQHRYSFKDEDKQNSSYCYYRLKQTDFNGDFSYSDIKTISNKTIQSAITVYPNPYEGKTLSISGFSDKSALITLFDEMGITIFSNTVEVYNGTISINIDKQLSRGIYVLKCVSEKQLYSEQLFIK